MTDLYTDYINLLKKIVDNDILIELDTWNIKHTEIEVGMFRCSLLSKVQFRDC